MSFIESLNQKQRSEEVKVKNRSKPCCILHSFSTWYDSRIEIFYIITLYYILHYKKRHCHLFSADPIIPFSMPIFISPSSRLCPTQMKCFQKTKETHYRHSSSQSTRLCERWSCLPSPFAAQASLRTHNSSSHCFCTCHPSSSEVKLKRFPKVWSEKNPRCHENHT